MRIFEYSFGHKDVNIYVLGDFHVDSIAFMEDEFKELAQRIKNDPKGMCVILGDVMDSDRPTTRVLRKQMFVDRQEAYSAEDEQYLLFLKHKLYPLMEPLRGKILGILDGDHFRLMSNGITSTELICSEFKCDYYGDGQAIIKLVFNLSNSKTAKSCKVMHLQHGMGFGKRAGTALKKIEDVSFDWEGIDIFVRGHSHSTEVKPQNKKVFNPVGCTLREREIWFVNTCSTRRCLLMGETDYAEKKMYSSTNYRFPKMLFIKKSKRVLGRKNKTTDSIIDVNCHVE